MNLSLVTNSTKQLGRAISRNSPTILTALGVAGLLTTVILAVKATPKAMEILEYEKQFRFEQENAITPDEPIEILDTIELTWKCYIPTILMGVATASCIIGANHISLRRSAVLTSLYSIAETSLKEYQQKVVETIGDKKEEKIREEIVKDKIESNPPKDNSIILTGKGNYLCYDVFSGRYFRTSVEEIQRAEIRFNQKLLREGWMDINMFYDEVGLEPIELGNQMGWIAQYAILELKFTSTLTKDTEPCLVMEYRVPPKPI